MGTTDEDVLNSLLEKLYHVVVGADDINKEGPLGGSFVSFTMPGIPVANDDLDFSFVAPKPDEAADFASLVNGVPPPTGRWFPSNRSIADIYKRVLNETIRPVVVLNDTEKKRLAAAQEMLTHYVDVVDLETGVVKKRPADTPLYEAYQDRKTKYLNALAKYKSLQADAQGKKNDPATQAKWAAQGPILRQKVKTAFDRWTVGGRRQIEEAINTISELGRGTGERWAEMEERLRLSQQTTTAGAEFYFTKFFPSTFWDEAHSDAWTKFSMSHEEVHTVDEKSAINWGGGAGATVGLWSVSASASYAEQKSQFKSDGELSSVEVELIRVPIRRSWWDPTVFWDRGWKFDTKIANSVLSDGARPPSGEMTCYATALIVARNLKLGVKLSSQQNSTAATQFSTSGSVGYGPFSIKGNYSRNTDRKTHDFVETKAGLEAAGMQIIGFICELLPKSPNPDPALNWQA